MYCPRCGRKMNEGDRFCRYCGPVRSADVAPVPDPAPQPAPPEPAPAPRRRPVRVIVVAALVLVLAVAGIVAALGGRAGGSSSGEPTPTEDFVLLDEGFTDEKVVDEASARRAIVGSSAGLGDANLGTCSAQASPIGTTYRFQQLFEGVPVEGCTVVVTADDEGTATMLSSNARDVAYVSTEPTVSEDDAEAAAVAAVEDATWALPGGRTIRVGDDEEPAKLCWKFLVPSEGALAEVLVSAETGEVLEAESGWNASSSTGSGYDPVSGRTVSLNVWSQGDGTYRLYDKERETSTFDVDGGATSKHLVLKGDDGSLFLESGRTGDGGAPCYYDVDQKEHEVRFEQVGTGFCWDIYDAETGELLGKNARYRGYYISTKSPFDTLSEVTSTSTVFSNGPAVAAASRAAAVHDFYADVLGREGHDGAGGSVTVIVNDTFFELKDNLDRSTSPTQSMNNTAGGYMVLTFGVDSSIADDLVAHEYTHGVEITTSALDPTGESGALREAMGDLMGQVFEDWRNDGALNNNCDWLHDGGLRSLADPAASTSVENGRSAAHPARVGDAAWGSPCDEFDDGYVHNNSTVVSHAGYLMCAGQDGLAGDALTTEQLAQLVYASLFALPSDCTFSQYRTIVERVASVMAGQSLLTPEQVERVTAAFDEVGITPWETSADSDEQVAEDVAPTVDALAADRERAAAFLGKFDELIAQHGNVRTTTHTYDNGTSSPSWLSGTCFAKLVDFGDGVERFVVAYSTDPEAAEIPTASLGSYALEVWEYDAAAKVLKLVASGDVTYTNGGFPYVIVGNRASGGRYLVTGQLPDAGFWGVRSDGTFGALPADEFKNLSPSADEQSWLMANSGSDHGSVDDTVALTKDTYDELLRRAGGSGSSASEKTARAQGFLATLDRLEATYGTPTVGQVDTDDDRITYTCVIGLCYASLVDFGDGQERLVTVSCANAEVPKVRDYENYEYLVEVWEQDGSGSARQVLSHKAFTTTMGYTMLCYQKGPVAGRTYLMFNTGEASYTTTLFGLRDDGTFGQVKEFVGAPGTSVDGASVDSGTFTDELAAWSQDQSYVVLAGYEAVPGAQFDQSAVDPRSNWENAWIERQGFSATAQTVADVRARLG